MHHNLYLKIAIAKWKRCYFDFSIRLISFGWMKQGGCMLPRISFFAMVVVVLCAGDLFSAERFLVMKIGPTWPKELQLTEKPTAWDGSLVTGLIVDQKIAFGGGVDFLWNVNRKTTKLEGNTYQIDKEEKTFMFPVSGYLAISPIPQFRVQPCISTQLGLNTMYYSSSKDTTGNRNGSRSENGWYMGFYWKIAADAVFNLGETSGLFAGLDYQFSKPKKLNVKSDDIFTQRDMNGVGIRMGLRVMY